MNPVSKFLQALLKKNNPHAELDKNQIDELFLELDELQIKKQRITHYMNELQTRQEAHKQYESLDQDSISRINILAQQAKDIEEKKNNLKGRLISTNAALNRLSQFEEEIPDLISEMRIAEKRRRETENNIVYLKEERIDLEEERDALLMGYRFLRCFSIIMVIIIGVCLLVSFILLQVLRERIWFILSGIVVVTMLFIVGIVLTKEKMERELKNNSILQQKAAKYLNKYNIKLINQSQYLFFQYHKLGVESVAQLEMYYNRYLKNKNNEKVYLQMNDKLNDIEEEILNILHSKNILLQDIGALEDWILQPKRLSGVKMVHEDEQKTKEQLAAINAYEVELWREIYARLEDPQYKAQIQEKLKGYSGENMLDKIHQDA